MKTSYSQIDLLLAEFDFGRADLLDRIAADFPASDDLLQYLIKLAEGGDARIEAAATGLLKRYQDAGAIFSETLSADLLHLLPAATHWESRLHLLQMLPRLSIPRDEADSLYSWLRDCLAEKNKFVRAWTYTGLHRLVLLFSEYRDEIAELFEKAARDESASVRARLRHLPSLGNVPSSKKRK